MNWFKNNRILVPFDFSDACVDAVKFAQRLAEDGSDIHVLHVLRTLSKSYPYSAWDEESELNRKAVTRDSMEQKLADLDVKITQVHLDVTFGNEGEAIVDLAKEIDAGLIVIPSHGRKGVQRFLLGSVAERVVRLAPCPVLVLKE